MSPNSDYDFGFSVSSNLGGNALSLPQISERICKLVALGRTQARDGDGLLAFKTAYDALWYLTQQCGGEPFVLGRLASNGADPVASLAIDVVGMVAEVLVVHTGGKDARRAMVDVCRRCFGVYALRPETPVVYPGSIRLGISLLELLTAEKRSYDEALIQALRDFLVFISAAGHGGDEPSSKLPATLV